MKFEEIDLRGFCAAPWVDAVLYINGDLGTCCYNSTIFGNWQKEKLKDIWHGDVFHNFRKHIIKGDFPDISCKICYYNGTARTLYSELNRPLKQNMETIFAFFNKKISEISNFESQINLRRANADTDDVIKQYFSVIGDLETRSSSYSNEIKLALKK